MKKTPWKQYAARRRINIKRWLAAQKIQTYKKLINHCAAIGVETPTLEELKLQGVVFQARGSTPPEPQEMQDVTVSAEVEKEVEQPASEADQSTASQDAHMQVWHTPNSEGELVPEEPAVHTSSDAENNEQVSSPPEGLKIDSDGFLVPSDAGGEGE